MRNKKTIDVYDMANLSHWAYKSQVPPGCSRVKAFESKTTDTQGFMVMLEPEIERLQTIKVLCISFRGSKGLHDWLRDFFLISCPLGGGDLEYIPVHAGALGAWESVQKRILDEIEAQKPDRILLTGHSLGGQLCAPAAEGIYRQLGLGSTRVTFGAPPFGKCDWTQYHQLLPLRHLRFRAGRDFVSVNPLHQAILGYRHEVPEITLGPWYDFRRYTSHFMDGYKRYLLDEDIHQPAWKLI